MMTIDEAIKHCEEVAEEKELKAHNLKQCRDYGNPKSTITSGVRECEACASEHRQLAKWLRELKAYREFADWLVEVVLEDDWEESADFYVEVLCRKLSQLGKLKVVDNKYYIEVNTDEDSD